MNDPNKEKYLKWTLLPFFGSWIFYLVLISLGSLGTAIARKVVSPDIELIPETLLRYALEFTQLYVWVPIAWLLGETGVRLLELFVALRTGSPLPGKSNSNTTNSNTQVEEQLEDSFEEANKEYINSQKDG